MCVYIYIYIYIYIGPDRPMPKAEGVGPERTTLDIIEYDMI